jgi:hypothetical protein
VSGLQLSSGSNTRDLQLTTAIEEQRVTVDDLRGVSTDPNSNKTARMVSGKDLNALSDDPNELAAQLDALAGPDQTARRSLLMGSPPALACLISRRFARS